MSQPELIIIAGPNGAGKSTLADDIVRKYGIQSFDFDKEYYSRWAKFGYDPAVQAGCKEYTSKLFEQEIGSAFHNRKNFCFETNYHSSDVIKYINDAEKAGYKKLLIFIGLRSDDIAKKRVAFRAANKGHFVSDKEIEFRFKNGLKMLDQSYGRFDRIILTESYEGFKIEALVQIAKNGVVQRGKPNYLKFLPRLRKEINNSQQLDQGISF